MTSKLSLAEANSFLKQISLPLRAHQIEGIETILGWYNKGHGGILADEMGLGKTCQAVVSVSILSTQVDEHPRILIICPLSVIDHWENEIKRFSCNRLKLFRYYGTQEKRIEMRRSLLRRTQWNVLLTTFEIFLADKDTNLLYFDEWDFAIIDEAHRIKNDFSLLHKAVNSANIQWLLLMTGTPIQNAMLELYSLLKLIDPKKFPEKKMEQFVEKYDAITKDEKVQREFRELFDEYCIRRTKKILEDVPGLSEVLLYHSVTPSQYDLYKALLSHNRDYFLDKTNSVKTARQSLMSTIIQLCKCCNHPYLFDGIEPEPYTEGEHLIEASGKTVIMDRLLTYLKDKGHKVLIFSQMKRFIDIVHDIFLLRGYNFEQFDGTTKAEERLRAIENFQRPDSDVFAFLLTTKSGGLGLNLTAADTIIFLDWDFNPQNDKQAAARCHRIGQKKPVKIIRLIAKNTVEELIKYRASKKLKLSELVLGTEEKDAIISKADFANLIIRGLKNLQKDQEGDDIGAADSLTDEQLEQQIGKTLPNGQWEIKLDDDNAQLQEDEDEENTVESIYVFEGRDYTEDHEAFKRITAAYEAQPKPTTSGGNEHELIERAVRKTTAATQIGLERTSRPKLTEQEKEERRRKKREQEKQRREKAAADKERRKQQLWMNNSYITSNLPLPQKIDESDLSGKSEETKTLGTIFEVQGDVTKPERAPGDKSPCVLILQIVDDGGYFGTGGVFTALRNLNGDIQKRYQFASRMDDLHRGDAHLIENICEQQESVVAEELNPDENEPDAKSKISRKISVVLMVVQSVKDRYTKMINLSAFRHCLQRVQHYASQHQLTSIHMPQIWFGLQNLDETQVRRLIDQYLCSHGINAYIYKFRRPGGRRPPIKFNHKQLQRIKIKRSPSPRTPSPSKRKRTSPSLLDLEPRKRARPAVGEPDEDDDEMEFKEDDDVEDDYVPSESEDEEDEFEFGAEEDEESIWETEEEEEEDDMDGKRKPKRKKIYQKDEQKHKQDSQDKQGIGKDENKDGSVEDQNSKSRSPI